MIDILIPTYGRADRIARVAENIAAATASQHRIVFVVERNDPASVAAVVELGLVPVVNERAPNYSGAINTAWRADTEADFLFAGADDLRFHPEWDLHALDRMTDWVMVVGTNDWLNPYVGAGLHATHYLVDRRYLDQVGGIVDEGPGSFLHEGYSHQYTDTEFIGTAKARARFQPALDSIVEHLHALSGKGAPPDATTEKTNARLAEDSALYDARRPLWQNLSR